MMGRTISSGVGFVLLIVFILLSWNLFDSRQLLERLHAVLAHPGWLIIMFAAYWLSFLLKAAAWRAYLGHEHPIGLYLHGLFYSLLINHLLPVKIGDLVRTGILMKKARLQWDAALHSVMMMRLVDLLVLGFISAAGMLWLGMAVSWITFAAIAVMVILAGIAIIILPIRRWPFVQRHWEQLKAVATSRQGPYILLLVAVSWILEAAILLGIARMGGIELGVASSVWANSVTIGGQVFHITPGGIGTYENTLSGTLAVLGVNWDEAYATALLAHAFKFAAAYILGAYSLIRMPVRLREAREWIRIPRQPSLQTTDTTSKRERTFL
ncbi:flippase-like domain-containing protein [Paenibacillus oenotherae]|uniref:Phosphatidylglycerol lysyltransferase n=1 Tax=Paenibacillus oenotherae TaxID=1435645 RepID=A0ABS7DAB6_9BACL|nr:lysylphosphatidylglycerol synthase transmembrane domain-containing protein [Paenibacillus oenotherae]MBW7476882.1 flippase-like domain-containing protein [Paenibacillus oenotherae]